WICRGATLRSLARLPLSNWPRSQPEAVDERPDHKANDAEGNHRRNYPLPPSTPVSHLIVTYPIDRNVIRGKGFEPLHWRFVSLASRPRSSWWQIHRRASNRRKRFGEDRTPGRLWDLQALAALRTGALPPRLAGRGVHDRLTSRALESKHVRHLCSRGR